MIILEFVVWLVVEVLMEAFFALFRALDEDKGAGPLAQGPFPGTSLLVAPVLLGAFMELWGGLLSRWGRSTSHLATWYGGASMGLGLAAGRFTMFQALAK